LNPFGNAGRVRARTKSICETALGPARCQFAIQRESQRNGQEQNPRQTRKGEGRSEGVGGRILGNERLRAEGRADKAKGQFKDAAGKAADAAREAIGKASDALRNRQKH